MQLLSKNQQIDPIHSQILAVYLFELSNRISAVLHQDIGKIALLKVSIKLSTYLELGCNNNIVL